MRAIDVPMVVAITSASIAGGNEVHAWFTQVVVLLVSCV